MLLEILPLIEHSQLDTLSDSPLASKNEKQCECDSELWSRLFSILTFIGENILQLGREPLKRYFCYSFYYSFYFHRNRRVILTQNDILHCH
jgi:hypothetical protein